MATDTRHCGHGTGLHIDCAGCAGLILRLPVCGCGERLVPPGRERCEPCEAERVVATPLCDGDPRCATHAIDRGQRGECRQRW